jgi:diaminohydroxyphosphoribosylaminopyrimidine deaminase/5-amino-6-(5-phosphoribosylamino)uracil reductase
MVGAVVVAESGEMIAEGCHAGLGLPHAEAAALAAAGERSRGATLYVSLEPCRHQGRTPPCTDAVLASGVRRVVFGARDPIAEHGGGAELLRSAGVEVTGGVLDRECRELNAPFFKHSRTGLPLVTAKWAMSLDGKTATRTGDSKWISGEHSRALAHAMRAVADCVMIGAGTLRADDPLLTARTGVRPPRQPARLVISGSLDLDPTLKLFNSGSDDGGPVIVATSARPGGQVEEELARRRVEVLHVADPKGPGVDLAELMRELGRRGVQTVLLEGGGRLAARAFEAGIVDEVAVFLAPMIIGGELALHPVAGTGAEAVSQALGLERMRVETLPDGLFVSARVGRWEWLED